MIQLPFGESPFHCLQISVLRLDVSVPAIAEEPFGEQILVFLHEEVLASVDADQHVENIG
jgi:hypothetical protein